jgi:transcriptional regulator with GAF, ATPase, and Fis domain
VLDNDTKESRSPGGSARQPTQNVTASLDQQFRLSGFMLVIAGIITFFGLLIVVPPIVNKELAPHWSWATPHMVLIVLLSLAMLALVGLAHQQRYLNIIRARIEHTRVEAEARAGKQATRLYALLDITQVMADNTGLDTLFDRITEVCAEVFNCDQVSFMFFNEENEELVVRSVSGPAAKRDMIGAERKLGEGISGWAAKRREALLLGQECSLSDYPDLELNSPTISAAMVVPIVLSGVLVGVINVSSRSRGVDYDNDDFRALQVFAENVGTCVRQAQDQERMRQTIRELENSLQAKGAKGNVMALSDSGEDD